MSNISLFRNVKSRTGVPFGGAWSEIIEKQFSGSGAKFELWAPARFRENRRNAESVIEVCALCLDYDNFSGSVEDELKRWPYYGYWHFTKSHVDASEWTPELLEEWSAQNPEKDAPESPPTRFRIIIPYRVPISPESHTELYEHILEERGGDLDAKTKDPGRIWFLPTSTETSAQMLPGGVTAEPYDPQKHLLDYKERKESRPKLFTPNRATAEPASEPYNPNGQVALEMRITSYLAQMPPAIQGSDGSKATFNAARKIADFLGAAATEEEVLRYLSTYYNPRCQPPWSESELRHKAKDGLNARTKNPMPTAAPSDRVAQKVTPTEIDDLSSETPTHAYKPKKTAREIFGDLLLNKDGAPKPTAHSIGYILFENFAPIIRFDSFTDSVMVHGSLPWSGKFPRVWEENDTIRAVMWLEGSMAMSAVSTRKVQEIILAVGRLGEYDSYQEYMDALPEWDGVDRLSTWLVSYFGAMPSRYTKLVGRSVLLSMVARCYEPGAKVDTMMVLEGAQGIRKSTAVNAMALSDDWYMPTIPDVESKDSLMLLQGKTVVEIGEMAAFEFSKTSKAKDFVTMKEDKFRPPYQSNVVTRGRRCIFVGTTNRDDYLRDATGNRRYLPIRCHKTLDVDLFNKEKGQLLAQARKAYREGEKWFSKELQDLAQSQQKKRVAEDPWQDTVLRYCVAGIRRYSDGVAGRKFISMHELLGAVGVSEDKVDRKNTRRIKDIMTGLGWEDKRVCRSRAGKQVYVRGFMMSNPDYQRMIDDLNEATSEMEEVETNSTVLGVDR